MTDLMPFAEDERGDLLALLRGLSQEQWDSPSLCPGWRVRDVVVHMVSYDELTPAQTIATFVRGGLRVGTVNQVAIDRYRGLSAAELVELVERCRRPRGLSSGLRGGIALTDGMIHQQDIRRPLKLARAIPEERLVRALEFSLGAPTLPSRRNRRGLRLVATDADWSIGRGPEVSGPGEVLLMACAGRAVALDDLAGQGLSTLRARVRPSG